MSNIFLSSLYDQTTFYKKFIKDLHHSKTRVVIESPFITKKRMQKVLPILSMLCKRGVKVIINTKPFDEHEQYYQDQAIWAVEIMQYLGIEVLFTCGHHRKIAIIDDEILYEGSLNILSHNNSCELMRRIQDKPSVKEMIKFTGLRKWCK